ncbi:ATP-binding protein [Aerosakkonema funiforme]|uniref:hybrid sensor histidine kinase/response regulator n=1 Tax=Aerosakkonema funiforme TaxID=1246630 RepID=UPI0035B9FB0C
MLLLTERNGYLEEAYFTFSYSPLPEDNGESSGVFGVVTEETERVLSDRRLRTLRELGAQTAYVKTVEEACQISADVLANNAQDIPFALIYLLDADRKEARLVSTTNLEIGTPVSPSAIELSPNDETSDCWSLNSVLATRESRVIDNLIDRFGLLPGGAWDESPNNAIVLPLTRPGQEILGVLIAGISPYRPLDDDYEGFFDLVAGQVTTAIADTLTYEEERQRAEALAELDRAKTIFFNNVSHEFRTPLTLMLAPAEDALADRDNPLSPNQRQRIEVIQRNGLRLLKLVNTLLDFSRIESDRSQAVYEPTDLASFTAELASVFRSAIEQADLRLVVDCSPLPEPIYVDRQMWEKIVLNLLSNALKFTFEGEITVSLRLVEAGDRAKPEQEKDIHNILITRFIELTVKDTGIGISAAEIPHLLERFHRVKGAKGRTFEGSGIGLSLVQELVKLHGGTVRVSSVEGEGSCFTVSIPTGSAHLPQEQIGGERTLTSTAMGAVPYLQEALQWLPEEGESENINSAAPLRPRSPNARILLVDDNADMRDYVKRLLSERWQVDTAANGASALATIQKHPPDLVLSDVMMPEMDGFQLLQALRSHPDTKSIPIVLLSARAGEEATIEGLEAGADDYLIKPFSARELIARINTQLQMSRLRQEQSASRLKNEFLLTVTHELQAPLAAILGWVRLLQTQNFDEAKTARALATIERNATIEAKLVKDLLDLSSILAGKLRLKSQLVDLVVLVQNVVNTFREQAEKKNIKLIDITSNLAIGNIFADGDRIRQIINYLLDNAIKFTPEGGVIEIELSLVTVDLPLIENRTTNDKERLTNYVQIAVTDTGIGISPEFLPFVFDRFTQAEVPSRHSPGGVGIGLAIARLLVELHGGTIEVASEGEGRGATFTVRLPLTHITELN